MKRFVRIFFIIVLILFSILFFVFMVFNNEIKDLRTINQWEKSINTKNFKDYLSVHDDALSSQIDQSGKNIHFYKVKAITINEIYKTSIDKILQNENKGIYSITHEYLSNHEISIFIIATRETMSEYDQEENHTYVIVFDSNNKIMLLSNIDHNDIQYVRNTFDLYLISKVLRL